MAFTAEDVANYLIANPGLTDAQIATIANQAGVSAQTLAEATGVPVAQIEQRAVDAGVPLASSGMLTGSTTTAPATTQTNITAPTGMLASPTPTNVASGIILAGDSWLANDKTLATQIQNVTNRQTANLAVGGSTSADTLQQLNEFLKNGGSFASGTTIVLNTGGNDFLKGVGRDVTKSNIEQIVSTLSDKGVNVVLSGAPKVNTVGDITSNQKLEIDPIYKEIADKNKNVTLVDSMSNLLSNSNLRTADNIHLNSVGQAQFADSLVKAITGNTATGMTGSGVIPPRPTFDSVFSEWNERHNKTFGTYLNLARTGQENVDKQVAELNTELAKQQAAWDQSYGTTQQAQVIKNNPPPTWNNIYATWSQKYKDVFGTDVLDRPWNSDENAIRQKQELDNAYLAALKDYNSKNGTNVQPDPAVLGSNVQPNAIFKVPDVKKPSFLESVAPFALMLIPGMQGLALSIGTALGATGAAATAIGTGILTGTASGLITGDAKTALVTGITAGAGNYFTASGMAGSLLNSAGLGEVATALNLPTTGAVADAAFYAADAAQLASQGLSPAAIAQNLTAAGLGPGVAETVANLAATGATQQQLANALTSTPGGMFSANVSDAQFIGSDAAQLAAQGLNTKAIEQNLIQAGVDPFIAADAAQLAAQGFNASTITQNLTQSGAGMNLFPGLTTTTGLPTGTPTTTTPPGAPPPATPGTPTTPGLPNIPGLPSGLTNTLQGLLSNQNVTNLVGTGIDFARLKAISDAANAQGRQLAQEAAAIGTAAQTPFTPYTLTTGTGTATISPGAATTTAAAPYEALRGEALSQAQETLGAINPAQATQQFYQNLEALAGPTRQREQEALLGRLSARGLLGIGRNLPTAGGEVAGVNPFMESLLSAQEQGRLQQALTAQQFGTSEAARQQALAQNLQTQAMGIDQQTMRQLEAARLLGADERSLAERNAAIRARAGLAGLELRAPYEQLGLIGQIGGINAVAGAGRGLFGLPTQPGGTSSTNLVSEALKYLSNAGMSQSQANNFLSNITSGLDTSGNSQATQNLVNELQRYGIF